MDPAPAGPPAQAWPSASGLPHRDPWLHGILTAVTLSLWAYHWCYVTIRDGREHHGQSHRAGLLTALSIGFLAGGLVLTLLLFLPLLLAALGAMTGFGGRDPADVVQGMIAAGAAAIFLTVFGILVVGALFTASAVLRYVLLYQAADVVGALGADAGRDRSVPAFVYPVATFGVGLLGIPFLPYLAWGGSVLHLQMEWNKTLESPLPARPEAAGV